MVARARKAYEGYELHVVHRLLVEFVTVDLSALYSDVTKDRLYCDRGRTRRRAAPPRSCCTSACARSTTLAAPILCFTAEDIWSHMPHREGDPDSVHLAQFPPAVDDAEAVDVLLQFDKLLAWRERVNRGARAVPRRRSNKSTDARVTLRHPPADPLVTRYRDELADLFIVSEVAAGARRRPRTSRSSCTPARAASAAASTSTPWPPTRTMSASVAPRRCAR